MAKKNVIAIGIFDGVHKGHKKILAAAVRIAGKNRTKAIAVTFYPHPLSVLRPGKSPLSLISLKHRINLIKSAGVDRCAVIGFTKDFAAVSAEDFIKKILIKKFNAGWVVIGEDFTFGAGRKGDYYFLKARSSAYGFKTVKIKALKYKGAAISSSVLRQLIREGRLKLAERLLGRPVSVTGTVVRGNRLGRVLGFPTANINPHHEAAPPSGVYAVKVNLDKKHHNGVLNIGIRPTFYGLNKQDKEPAIEVFVFNFSKTIYGKNIEVLFVKKLRDEKKFDSKEDLVRQITKDIKEAESAL
jgi:riboflavin kinase/FMN adenylyltransferase